jgi:gliding motility-associated-like protein
MKKYLLLILICCFVLNTKATHISGGELYYEYLGPGDIANTDKYKITMVLYRDCNSIGAELNSESVNIGIYLASNGVRQYSLHLNKEWVSQDPPVIQNSPNAVPCIIGDKSVCFQYGRFSNTIDLARNPDGYLLSWIRYSRQFLSNVDYTAYPERAIGGTFTTNIPGDGEIGTGTNNSAKFSEGDTALVCANRNFTIDYSAKDKDGDSLVYYFCSAYVGGDSTQPNPPPPNFLDLNEIVYKFPYSGNSPLGPGVTLDRKTGLISGKAPADPGKYVVNVCCEEWRNGLRLNIHHKDFILKVGSCDIPEAILKPSYITCDGFNLIFTNTSTSGLINSYYWDFGDDSSNADTSLLPEPSYSYKDSGTYFVKLIVNKGEKCSDSTIAKALVYPGFIPDFDVNGSCALNPFTFRDLTTSKYGVVDSWFWDFGDVGTLADTSKLKTPVYKYTSPQTADVTLMVTNSKGCLDTLVKTIVIADKPDVMLPFRDTLICVIDTLRLHASSTSLSAAFSWSPNINIDRTNVTDPLVSPPTTTTYFVTVNDKGCINTDSIIVNVVSAVQLNIGNDSTICLTDSIQLKPQTNALYFAWSPGTNFRDSTEAQPFILPTAATTYQLTASIGKCTALDSIKISVVPYPKASAGVDTSICFGKTTLLQANITGSQFSWSPTNSLLNENTLTPTAGPQATTTYILTVTDVLGCPKPSFDTIVVNVIPKILAFAGNDTAIVANQPLQLDATGGTVYNWSPITGLSNPNISNPIAILGPERDTITYFVNVGTSVGCNATDNIKVTIFKTLPQLFIPSAFTPNNDRLNDVLTPKVVGMQKFNYFKVFNRWGVLMFSTSEQGKGWDGMYGGIKQASGTYVYMAQAVDYSGKLINQKGTVVLIR